MGVREPGLAAKHRDRRPELESDVAAMRPVRRKLVQLRTGDARGDDGRIGHERPHLVRRSRDRELLLQLNHTPSSMKPGTDPGFVQRGSVPGYCATESASAERGLGRYAPLKNRGLSPVSSAPR